MTNMKFLHEMKRILVLLTVLAAGILPLWGQAALPSIMVVPSDAWCKENGFLTEYEHDGVTSYAADYRAALVNSNDLKLVISLINNKMAGEGFRLVDLESTLKNLETENALNSVTMSSMGDALAETPREQMSRVAKADIWIEVSWNMNQEGPQKSLTFIMRALDSYSQKDVASAMGTSGKTYMVELPVLVEEAVSSYFYDFTGQLKSYFDEIIQNGREIALEVRVWENAGFNLDSDMGDDLLGYLIEDWVMENAAGGMKTPVSASENILVFKGVRIPNTTPEGRQVDARYWTRSLVRMLRGYEISSKLYTKGLGQVTIVLGQSE